MNRSHESFSQAPFSIHSHTIAVRQQKLELMIGLKHVDLNLGRESLRGCRDSGKEKKSAFDHIPLHTRIKFTKITIGEMKNQLLIQYNTFANINM